MRTFVLTVVLMLIAGMAFAADIDGKWEGEMQGPPGGDPMKISYTFKAEGETLTGATKGMDGSDMTIQDGKIDGNNFSYTLNTPMGPMKHTGVVKGDTIELKVDMGDMGGGMEFPPMILKKVE